MRSLLLRTFLFLLTGAAIHRAEAQSVGLVLSGGGASGMAHIGVLMALEENGIPIDYIAGSSMGALVGAMYASGYSPWEMDSLFRTERYQLMAEGGVEEKYIFYFKQDYPDASVFNVKLRADSSLRTSLPTNLRSPVLIDFEQMRSFAGASAIANYDLDSLFVPFRCVASDITAREPVVFRQGDLAQAVRASMSYPFYFKPIQINGHLMMDGGLYNNFPSDVMYSDFLPDVMIGSNVTTKSPPPTESDLLSQLRAMVQRETNYELVCDHGLIVEPRTTVGTFDFSDPARTIREGYEATLKLIPEIRKIVRRRAAPADVWLRREAFRARQPRVRFGDIRVGGLNKASTSYAMRMLGRRAGDVAINDLKPRYFRLYADQNVAELYPRATFHKERQDFDLDVRVEREKELDVRVGGMFSSRPINTGMLGVRYHFMGHSSNQAEAMGYFGKFYSAGQVKLRADFSGRTPVYFEPAFTLHRWDWFTSFASFFDDVRPPYIVQREQWGGFNTGVGLGNKGLGRFDMKYAQTRDSYYQSSSFSPQDTADVTEFFHVTTGLLMERNSLNRKQHPNAGECLKAEVRYVNGEERTTPGSLVPKSALPIEQRHEWLMAKVTLDKYFLPKGHWRFGVLAEGVYSNQPFFQNYTATVIRTPAFQPTPETRTYFIDAYRAPQYLAGGLRSIIAVARNKFDLRLEGYVFQPYAAIERGEGGQAEEGTAISDRSYIGSGSLIYQSPIGPIWFNTSYLSGRDDPWIFSLSFGYVIFAQRALE